MREKDLAAVLVDLASMGRALDQPPTIFERRAAVLVSASPLGASAWARVAVSRVPPGASTVLLDCDAESSASGSGTAALKLRDRAGGVERTVLKLPAGATGSFANNQVLLPIGPGQTIEWSTTAAMDNVSITLIGWQ